MSDRNSLFECLFEKCQQLEPRNIFFFFIVDDDDGQNEKLTELFVVDLFA